MARTRKPMERLFAAVFVLFGWRLGLSQISDNSMLTHLRTGIEIATSHSIPRHDHYSYVVAGKSWVVQSWLAEWTYGWLYRLDHHFHLVMIEQAVLLAATVYIMGRLCTTGSGLKTLLALLITVTTAAQVWSPRPLLFGLLAFALTVLIVIERRRAWLLFPIALMWTWTHGSFVLGGVWLVAYLAGLAFDENRKAALALRRYPLWFAGGVLAAGVWPLGPKQVLFPFLLTGKSSALKLVTEWRSPDFHPSHMVLALVAITAFMVIVAVRRVSWALALSSVAFVVLSLYSLRNFSLAGIAMAPALAQALSDESSETKKTKLSLLELAVMCMLVFMGAIYTIRVFDQPAFDFKTYPVKAVNCLRQSGLGNDKVHWVHSDITGNYLIFLDGTRANVYDDDRFDLYSAEHTQEAFRLLRAISPSFDVLNRYNVRVVLVDPRSGLATVLSDKKDWHLLYRDKEFAAYYRGVAPHTSSVCRVL